MLEESEKEHCLCFIWFSSSDCPARTPMLTDATHVISPHLFPRGTDFTLAFVDFFFFFIIVRC